MEWYSLERRQTCRILSESKKLKHCTRHGRGCASNIEDDGDGDGDGGGGGGGWERGDFFLLLLLLMLLLLLPLVVVTRFRLIGLVPSNPVMPPSPPSSPLPPPRVVLLRSIISFVTRSGLSSVLQI